MLYKVIFLFFILLMFSCATYEHSNAEPEGNNIYLVGISEAIHKSPIIVDINNEKAFYSNLIFLSGKRHEVFFDLVTHKLIVIRIKATRYIEIFLVDPHAKVLPNPIFTTNSFGRYSHSRSAWSQSTRTLCLTGKYHTKTNGKRKLTLTCLRIQNSEVSKKTFNLNETMYSHTGIWTLSDQLLVTGRKRKISHGRGEKSDIHLFINLSDWNTIEGIIPSSNKFSILGNLNQNNLVASDHSSIYSYNSRKLVRLGDFRENIGRIYGADKNGNGYFAQIYMIKKDNDFQYEKMVIASVPWRKKEKYETLFSGNVPGSNDSIVYSNKPLNFVFTDTFREIE